MREETHPIWVGPLHGDQSWRELRHIFIGTSYIYLYYVSTHVPRSILWCTRGQVDTCSPWRMSICHPAMGPMWIPFKYNYPLYAGHDTRWIVFSGTHNLDESLDQTMPIPFSVSVGNRSDIRVISMERIWGSLNAIVAMVSTRGLGGFWPQWSTKKERIRFA